MDQGLINHVALVLDASGSMQGHRRDVVRVADEHVKRLADLSKQLDQETRVTAYTFDYSENIQCIYYDKDALRLPSLEGKYKPGGSTALLDATARAINDLKHTATLYGDHAFLVYVLTDGYENASKHYSPQTFKTLLDSLPDNWTKAAFVPDASSLEYAKQFGFPMGNMLVWDSTVPGGIETVNAALHTSTQSYFAARSSGVRSSTGLFTLDTSKLGQKIGMLKPTSRNYVTVQVLGNVPLSIREFCEARLGVRYRLGAAFYQLTKPEDIQSNKQVAIRDKKGNVYVGQDARQLLSLPDYTIRVNPAQQTEYTIFVQSTSVNRKLVPGTEVLYFS